MCFLLHYFHENFELQRYKLFLYEKHFQRINLDNFSDDRNRAAFAVFIRIFIPINICLSRELGNDC